MITTTQQLKFSDLQIDQLKRQIARSKLVDNEISSLPDGIRTYEGVGRMFILQPMGVLKENLKVKSKSCEEKIKTIETNKTYLERSIRESENSLRELVLSKQRASCM